MTTTKYGPENATFLSNYSAYDQPDMRVICAVLIGYWKRRNEDKNVQHNQSSGVDYLFEERLRELDAVGFFKSNRRPTPEEYYRNEERLEDVLLQLAFLQRHGSTIDVDGQKLSQDYSQSGLRPIEFCETIEPNAYRVVRPRDIRPGTPTILVRHQDKDPEDDPAPESVQTTISPSKKDSYPEPLDIWGESFPAPMLERHMLPKVIADYAWDEATRIGIDPACVAIPALGVCAAGLHDAIRLQPMRNDTQWTERACLWLGFVAPPSARKTPALESARRPAKLLEREWRQADQIAMAKYIQAHDEWKAACRDASKNGEQPPEEPVRPPLRRLSTTDYTMESLADILIDNERGILIFNDELAGFITGLDAYKQTKGKDRSAALELFNGSDRTVDRKGSYQYVPNWSACVAGGIQDDKLRQIAPSLAVDGMLQRFLMFRSNTLKPGEDRVPNMDAILDYCACYRTLVGQWEDQPIKLAPDAHKWREEVFEFADALAIDLSLAPAFRTHCGKLRGVFGRLVLTLHAIECSTRGEPIGAVVAKDTARMARDLIIEFFVPHELAIYADLFASNHEAGQDMRWIAGHILAHRLDQVRPRDIYRARDEFLSNRKRLFAALRGLEDMGWIEQLDRNGSKWLVNQKIHERYAERGQQERKDRDDNRARMIESKKKYAARKQNVESVG